jgi:magnesium-transporting ATPase (P-type)
MTKIQRLFLGIASFTLTLWVYWRVWFAAEPIGQNTLNAAEAGIPDTVSQSAWNELALLFLGLVGASLLTWHVATSTRTSRIPLWHALFMIALPVATTALFPFLGFFAPIFAFWICATGLVILAIRADRKLNN